MPLMNTTPTLSGKIGLRMAIARNANEITYPMNNQKATKKPHTVLAARCMTARSVDTKRPVATASSSDNPFAQMRLDLPHRVADDVGRANVRKQKGQAHTSLPLRH